MSLVWNELWQAMKANYADADKKREWVETTEEMYYDQLNAVPPVRMGGGAFLAGEPWNHDEQGYPVYAAFYHGKDRFFARYMTKMEYTFWYAAKESIYKV